MGNSLFEFEDYKAYLDAALSQRPHQGRGERTKLAQAAQCNTTYISQVLNGPAHFSLEQAERISIYLGHSSDEGHFFLLLVQLGRAGTDGLRNYFLRQLRTIREQRTLLQNRLEYKKTLSVEDQATYYSAWYYTSVHLLITMPGFQTVPRISRHLGMPAARIREILDFLVRAGLAVQEGERFKTGPVSIHLGADSPMISRHHSNWRAQAALDVDRGAADRHLHYSSVVTVAEKDVPQLRSILVNAIEQVRAVVKESKEDRLYCYDLDLFEVGGMRSG
jgi:uncharacterized protein (TIGR02147 family)